MSEPHHTLDLWDYRRRVGQLYQLVHEGGGAEETWHLWREERNRLFGHHPQSPLDPAQRVTFSGLRYYPYQPSWRFEVEVAGSNDDTDELGHSGKGSTTYRRFGTVRFAHGSHDGSLTLFWLAGYGGGVFLPFRDASNGRETYGGGRYLLDTAKGADLGHVGSKIVLDFNYSYHPSCVYNPTWSCPLAPPENRLDFAVPAGEKL